MNYKEMTTDALMERRTQIASESEKEGADTAALLEEARAINAELETRKAAQAAKEELRKAVEAGAGVVVEQKEATPMPNVEVRNSKEYINEYAEYIKTGEMRKLLTDNATNGTVAVPTFVSDIVKHAWENEGIMNLVKKAYVKGNFKIGFERSADAAVIHAEGGDAVTEEELVLGTVTLVPQSVKKWVSLSDEVMDLRGEAFLQYVYEELAYQIAKKAADSLVAAIEACTATSTATSVAVPSITQSSIAVGTIAKALGQLSDEASNPVVMMNKATWSAFKSAQYANGFSVDPFEGLTVLFNNTIKSFDAATTGDTYVIVGDLGFGALANFPNGEGIDFKFDEQTLMTQDLVRVLGREFIGIGVVAPNAFVKVTK